MTGTRLDGKVAVITGGASGIGAATCRRFVAEGARVVVADRNAELGHAVAQGLGQAAVFASTDVTVEESVAEAIATAIDEWGRIDCLFNNAGFGGALGPIAETSVADFDLTFDVLVKSVFLGMKHAAPVMQAQGSGSVISTSSIAALRGGLSPHLYGAAKAALLQLTRSVALELGASGVRVNAICPGAVVTPLLAGHPNADEAALAAVREQSGFDLPLGRAGEPDDLANMALFLASDESAWITGQVFVVDGGTSAGTPWAAWPDFMKTSRPIRHHRPDGR